MNTKKLITNMEDLSNDRPRQQCHFKITINVEMQKQCDYSNNPVNNMCE